MASIPYVKLHKLFSVLFLFLALAFAIGCHGVDSTSEGFPGGLQISSAIFDGETATVTGVGAQPGAPITWEGLAATNANARGDFSFSITGRIHGDCIGRVSDGEAIVATHVEGCVIDPFFIRVPHSGQEISHAEGDDGHRQSGVRPRSEGRFIDHGDGKALDTHTGIFWSKGLCGLPETTWEGALERVAGIGDGVCGHTDGSVPGMWRLPTVKEMKSLLHYGESTHALTPDHPFNIEESGVYWTSTTDASNPNNAYTVNMNTGEVHSVPKTTLAHACQYCGLCNGAQGICCCFLGSCEQRLDTKCGLAEECWNLNNGTWESC